MINNKLIVVGLATMSTRKRSLEQVINSLKTQTCPPDKIIIYNNDEMDFNATDNGKFHYFELEESKNEEVFFLSMDDDIYYPKNYIETMIQAIDKYKTIVTHHGRILKSLDVPYYSGHVMYNCFDRNTYEGVIDVPGTGVTAFDTAYFKPDIFNNENKRMSDLLFGLQAKEQDKTITILRHKKDFLKNICDDYKNSCHRKEKNNQTKQIEIANQIIKLKNKKV